MEQGLADLRDSLLTSGCFSLIEVYGEVLLVEHLHQGKGTFSQRVTSADEARALLSAWRVPHGYIYHQHREGRGS